MYDARALANFFLDRAERAGIGLTTMTLLKVLYFAHAWYLAKQGEPLVAQPFEAWKHGPVNRVVYDQFKHHKKRPIEGRAVSFDPRSMRYAQTTVIFDKDTSLFLQNIFDYYSSFHPFALSDLTHERGGPWDAVWSEAGERAVPGMIIPNDLIEAWFKANRALYWTDRERNQPT
ncbi:MAG: type II toxin-antitoxin system antitoxin SocA domain-containing protein [Sulfuricaulis sp.]|uniref:Panacea domain-containing protein n=1 Tax=Sulfuricaulis sp. TaxID=2003553 RepID=UPI0034A457A2